MEQRPPLVLLHGYPFDHTMWHPVMAYLKVPAKILAPDLPGFGLSAVAPGAPALETMADSVAAEMDRHQFKRAVVAGFSMGGYVALALAERHDAKIAGLALLNSQTAADSDLARSGRREMIRRVSEEGPAAALAAAVPKLFSRADSLLARYPESAAIRAGAEGLAWALEAMASRPDRQSVWQDLIVPRLMIHTTEDQFIPMERARALAEETRTPLIEFAGVGHASPLEIPREVATVLDQFLKRC